MIEAFPDILLLAQAAEAGQEPAMSGWMLSLILVAVFAVPIALGQLIAHLLKVKEFGNKLSVVLLAATLGLTPFISHLVRDSGTVSERLLNSIRLGIDLAGGTNLVYQVDERRAQEMGKEITPELMDQMVGAIGRRINPSGTEEVTVRRVGQSRIEVIIPGADEETVQRMKDLITKLGSLEFAILANERDHGANGTRYRGLIGRARQLSPNTRDLLEGTRVVARWREAQPGVDLERGRVATRTVTRDGEQVTEVLTIVSPEEQKVTGEFLTRANQTMDEYGAPAVGFTFNENGSYRFYQLTSRNTPVEGEGQQAFQRRLAIVLDGKVQSAPNINAAISSSGIITGQFTEQERRDLINVLNAGALEVPLVRDPVSEFSISPLLGADIREKGATAIIVSALSVLVFMGVYYMFAGLVANLCLVLNLVLVMGVMAFIDATFTLPGLAGLVLTIGMAVDANVLIFERIREESTRGSSLRMAIHNGFGRAFSAIIDANVTTLITAVVLYMIGTDQVRGFAVTLFIGIVMSLFTALYFGRLVFDLFERKRWIKNVRMLSLMGATRWDFLGKKKIAAIASAVVIVAGLVSLSARGADNLDIDFRGGTMLTFEFEEPHKRSEIRELLEKQFGTNITLEQLTLTAEQQDSTYGQRFRLRTTMFDTPEGSGEADAGGQQTERTVRELVNEAFEGTPYALRRVTVDYGPVEKIPAPDESTAGESAGQAASLAAQSEYAGGYRVNLDFSDDISVLTVQRFLANALEDLGSGYTDPQSLFELSGPPAAEGAREGAQAQRYQQIQLLVRPNLPESDLQAALASMQQTMADTPTFEEVTSFDSSVASEMQQSAILAILISMIAIVCYLWFRFQRITFGLAAVAALVHDVLVVLGSVALASYLSGTAIGNLLALEDFKMNLPMIAALLTVIGYSLNDTIVVFDRIRETRGKNPALTTEMVNLSLNQTLSRTLLTSFTTFLVVGILYWIGGEGIHGFAFSLLVGVIVGTYSSMYVASPVLVWLMNRRKGGASGTVTKSAPTAGTTEAVRAAG